MLTCRLTGEQLYGIYVASPANTTNKAFENVADAVTADLNAQLAEQQAAGALSDEALLDQAKQLMSSLLATSPGSTRFIDVAYKVFEHLIAAVRAQTPQPPQSTPSRGDAAWEAVERNKWRVGYTTVSPSRWAVYDADANILGIALDPLTAVQRALEVLEPQEGK